MKISIIRVDKYTTDSTRRCHSKIQPQRIKIEADCKTTKVRKKK